MDSRKPLTAGERQEIGVLLYRAGFETATGGTVDETDVADLHRTCRRLLSLLTQPPDAAVREAVERISSLADNLATASKCLMLKDTVRNHSLDLRTLLRAVQAPRLTGEQVEAVKIAETLLTDTMSDYGDCEHDLGHCICKYHSGVFAIRAAFPEAFGAGEVGRG